MSDDDDWETDPDFENDVTEEQQVRASLASAPRVIPAAAPSLCC